MKIKSFYKDQIYIITQSNHGSQQAFTAFDFGYLGYSDKGIYAPCDLKFKRKWGNNYDGGCEYWICEKAYIQIVHFTPASNKDFKVSEKIGQVPGDHVHISLNIENKWQVYLDYAERSAELYFWTYKQKHNKWTNWATYTDREIKCYTKYEMVKLQNPIKITTTNTIELNVRETPSTSAKIINKITGPTEFTTSIVASGDAVSGNTNWYGVLGGYISGTFVKEIPQDCSIQDAKILELEKNLAENRAVIENFTGAVSELNSTYQKLTATT